MKGLGRELLASLFFISINGSLSKVNIRKTDERATETNMFKQC